MIKQKHYKELLGGAVRKPSPISCQSEETDNDQGHVSAVRHGLFMKCFHRYTYIQYRENIAFEVNAHNEIHHPIIQSPLKYILISDVL